MSADLLRRAAALMRERAEAATPGPWEALADGYGDTSGGRSHEDRRDLLWVRSGPTNKGDIVSTYGQWTERSEFDVLHIASWHPAVALAVADWLDVAAEAEHIDFSEPPRNPRDRVMVYKALAVARAYLGEQP